MASVIISSGLSVADAEASSTAAGLSMRLRQDGKIEVYSTNVDAVEAWFKALSSDVTAEFIIYKIQPCLKRSSITPLASIKPAVQGESYFTAIELAQIYGFPAPNPSVNIVVGVVSFGGGLFGTVNSQGVLTSGDVIDYWTLIGIPTNEQPRVIIKPINGATNSPNAQDAGYTMENILDISAIGGACPSPNLTIILYITPNNGQGYYPILNYMYNTPVVVGGVSYKPDIISISWCIPELYTSDVSNSALNSLFTNITAAGISIFVATGDWGAPNSRDWGGGNTGPAGNDVNYPASHPNCTAVGGTTLVCPNSIYDASTQETAWTHGGGGISVIYSKPSYQSRISGTARSIPDVSAVADPNTGMILQMDGEYYIIGGTSLSAPLLAGFLAAINCRKYINPLLYSAPSNCFYDITSGNIGGGVVTGPGYDRCTGRGTINGAILATYLNGIQVTGVTLNQSTASVNVGATLQLTATVAPANATIKTLVWSSSNTSRATVSANGLVTGVSAGSATITVTTNDGSFTASCAVTIGASVAVSGVTLSIRSSAIEIGATLQLVATVSPANATNKLVTWSSSSSSVSVSQDGLVTGLSGGTATITVTTQSGSKTATSTVLVYSAATMTMKSTSATVITGKLVNIDAIITRPAMNLSTITWTSSDTGKAMVPSYGSVLSSTPSTTTIRAGVVGIANGSATITATSSTYGISTICGVTVATPVQSVLLNVGNVRLENGETFQAIPTIYPSSATNKNVSWGSSSNAIATVDASGLITAVSTGTARITVTTEGENRKNTLTASILTQVTGVTISASTLTVNRASTGTLTATVSPSDASNLAVRWASYNTRVATVSSSGVVTGVSAGQAIITVTTVNGGLSKSCLVTVV
jgi:uncharacterized protein YjdB